MKFTTLSLLVSFIPALQVAAHGYVKEITINGKPYKGNVPNGASNPSIIRQVNDVSPVKGAKNPAVNCGPNAKIAKLSADVQPGAALEFDWAGGDNSKWPHNVGSMLTYMASCGDKSCDKFNSKNARWFKIQQVGRKKNGDWAQMDLFNGGKAKVTLPKNLKAGNYLIRHEIIALHLGTQLGGAEFYASCAQLSVGGSGTGVPKPNELVSLPGAYSDNDPGIFYPDAFNKNAKYIFPGPPIAALAGDGGDNDNDNDNGNDAPAPPAPKPKPESNTNSGSSGSCRPAKEKAKAKAKANTKASSTVIELNARETPTTVFKASHRRAKLFGRMLKHEFGSIH